MYPKKCAECGGSVEVSSESIPFEMRGEAVLVDGIEHGRCTVCGESYLSLDATERLQKEAVRLLREAKGLLPPQEIQDLRHSLGLSQAAFESLLGVGAKTVVRWEKGTVFQSATADRLMRLIRHMPELVAVLSSGAVDAATRDSHARSAVRTVHAVDAVAALQRESVARSADAIIEDEVAAEIATTRAARHR